MRCPKCGNYEVDDAIVCSKCGAELPFDVPDNNNGSLYGSYSPYSNSKATKVNAPFMNENNGQYGSGQYNSFQYNSGESSYHRDAYGPYNPDTAYENKKPVYSSKSKNRLSFIVGIILMCVIFYGGYYMIFKSDSLDKLNIPFLKSSGKELVKNGDYVCEYKFRGDDVELILSVDGDSLNYYLTNKSDTTKRRTMIFESEYELDNKNVYFDIKKKNDSYPDLDFVKTGDRYRMKYNKLKKTLSCENVEIGEVLVFEYQK